VGGSGDVVGAGCPGVGGFEVRTVHSTPLVEDGGKRRVTRGWSGGSALIGSHSIIVLGTHWERAGNGSNGFW
jgi:hypothetical protein